MSVSYDVLIKYDSFNRIIDCNSSAFVSGAEWTKIDEGAGRKYMHAQNYYFPAPRYDDRGIPRYAYVPDGSPKWRERTQEEMEADYVPPVSETTLADRVGAVEIRTGDLEEALNLILSGVTE